MNKQVEGLIASYNNHKKSGRWIEIEKEKKVVFMLVTDQGSTITCSFDAQNVDQLTSLSFHRGAFPHVLFFPDMTEISSEKNKKKLQQYCEHYQVENVAPIFEAYEDMLHAATLFEKGPKTDKNVLSIFSTYIHFEQALLITKQTFVPKEIEPSNPFLRSDYCIVFSVEGDMVIRTTTDTKEYANLIEGDTYKFAFLAPYPVRVENIFVSENIKTIFVAFSKQED